MSPSRTPAIADSAPFEAHLTDYDRAHTATYLRLLDAAKEGAPWEEATQIVLGIDPLREPARAKQAYDIAFRSCAMVDQTWLQGISGTRSLMSFHVERRSSSNKPAATRGKVSS